MKNGYTIYSLRIARILSKEGFNYIGKEQNMENPYYDVFFFEKTQELIDRVESLRKGK